MAVVWKGKGSRVFFNLSRHMGDRQLALKWVSWRPFWGFKKQTLLLYFPFPPPALQTQGRFYTEMSWKHVSYDSLIFFFFLRLFFFLFFFVCLVCPLWVALYLKKGRKKNLWSGPIYVTFTEYLKWLEFLNLKENGTNKARQNIKNKKVMRIISWNVHSWFTIQLNASFTFLPTSLM